jgi:hypothetical protein
VSGQQESDDDENGTQPAGRYERPFGREHRGRARVLHDRGTS